MFERRAETSVAGGHCREGQSCIHHRSKRDDLGSRFETTSHDLDAEALAMLRRASVAQPNFLYSRPPATILVG
jgi:hypothetical protein